MPMNDTFEWSWRKFLDFDPLVYLCKKHNKPSFDFGHGQISIKLFWASKHTLSSPYLYFEVGSATAKYQTYVCTKNSLDTYTHKLYKYQSKYTY